MIFVNQLLFIINVYVPSSSCLLVKLPVELLSLDSESRVWCSDSSSGSLLSIQLHYLLYLTKCISSKMYHQLCDFQILQVQLNSSKNILSIRSSPFSESVCCKYLTSHSYCRYIQHLLRQHFLANCFVYLYWLATDETAGRLFVSLLYTLLLEVALLRVPSAYGIGGRARLNMFNVLRVPYCIALYLLVAYCTI